MRAPDGRQGSAAGADRPAMQGAAFGYRKMKLDPKARGVVGHLEAGAVEIGNRSHEAEAKTVAGAVAAALEPIKPSQNVPVFLDWDARPAIGHRKHGTVGVI